MSDSRLQRTGSRDRIVFTSQKVIMCTLCLVMSMNILES